MREYASPTWHPRPRTGNLTDDVVTNAATNPLIPVAARRSANGWTDVAAEEFLADVVATAKGLLAAGAGVGDRIGLVCKTSYDWTVLDYAIWWVGAVTVPAYETATDDQLRWILGDAGATIAIVQSAQIRQILQNSRTALPELRAVVCLDEGGVEALSTAGHEMSDDELEKIRANTTPDDLASIIYTSGTTGPPKGCMLTHGQLMFEVGAVCEALDELFGDGKETSTLLFLPLAHVFARVVQIACIAQRVKLGYSSDASRLLADLAGFKPTFLFAIPRALERLFDNASQRATADGRRSVFDAGVRVAILHSQARDGSGPGMVLKARHAMFDRAIYAAFRDSLGGNLTYAVTGGAPIGERLAHFFRGIGVPVLEGYGLTESTAALTVNTPGAHRIGTVGTPIPGTTVRVSDEGELQFKGGQVFAGYWHAGADGTAGGPPIGEVSLDSGGWLHTGDIGDIDDDGFVRVTGRRTEILVTAGGKSVAPAVLEERVRSHPLIAQCMVVGDGRPYVGALVTIDPGALDAWMASRGRQAKRGRRQQGRAPLTADGDLRAEVQLAIDDANAAVSQAEAIRRFAIVEGSWTEESGDLTPTLKLKRNLVMRRHRDQIASLYV